MESLICPKCQNPKGTKVIFNHIAQFNCFACLFQCHMKHYRAIMKEQEAKVSPFPIKGKFEAGLWLIAHADNHIEVSSNLKKALRLYK